MKHIFCDLDGTLLLDFKRIERRDIESLKKAHQAGYHLSIATGRLDYEIKALFEEYDLPGTFRISQNGGIIYLDDTLLYASYFTQEELRQTIAEVKKLPVLIFVQTADHHLIQRKLPIIKEFEKIQPFVRYDEMPDLYERLDELKVVTVSLWAKRNENRWMVRRLSERLPTSLVSYISSEYTIDITRRENAKGQAIAWLAERFGFKKEDTYVIGDSFNDISMFEWTHNSFVMEWADEAVRHTAQTVVSSVAEAVDLILQSG